MDMLMTVLLLVLIDLINGFDQQHDRDTQKDNDQYDFLYTVLTRVASVAPHWLSAVTTISVLI
jgi:hypothetical protein